MSASLLRKPQKLPIYTIKLIKETMLLNHEYILINKAAQLTAFKVASKSSFFAQPIMYYFDDECLVFRHTTIDDNRNILTPSLQVPQGFYHFTIYLNKVPDDCLLECKKYYFEDDSNEDRVLIHCPATT